MSLPVIISVQADAQVDAIDAWWRANREAAPELFTEELAEAFSTIGFAPDAGHRYPHPEVRGVRRVLLLGGSVYASARLQVATLSQPRALYYDGPPSAVADTGMSYGSRFGARAGESQEFVGGWSHATCSSFA